MKLLIIVLLAVQALSQELNSTLHSTPNGIQLAYPGEMVVFMCEVRGSNNLVWESDEYIGDGQRLTLASVERNGTERPAIGNSETVAVLIFANAAGEVVIVSQLRIRIDSAYPVASVQCINDGANTATSTSFQNLLADAPFIVCDKPSVCAGETVTCTCATGNSNTLAWMINGIGVQFLSNDTVPTRRNLSASNSFAILTENSNVNGIRVIISNVTVSASSDDIVLTCRNIDRTITTPRIVPIAAPETCPMNPTDVIPTENGNTRASGSCAGPIIAAIVVPMIIIVVAVLIVIVILIIYKSLPAKLKAQVIEIARLTGDVQEKDKEIHSLKKDKKDIEAQKDHFEDEMKKKETELTSLKEEMKKKEMELMSLKEEMKKKNKQFKEEKENLERSTAEQVGQSGKELEKLQEELERLQTEIKDKNEAIKGLPDIMKKEWTAVVQTVEDKLKMEHKNMLLKLKRKLTTEIDLASQDKGTDVDLKGGSRKGTGKTMTLLTSQHPRAGSGVDQTASKSESKPPKVEGATVKELSTEMKEERRTLLIKLREILETEIGEVLKQEETIADPEKVESLERAPRKDEESGTAEEAGRLEKKMEEEVNKILEGKKEPILPGQQGSLQERKKPPSKGIGYLGSRISGFFSGGGK